MLTFASQLMHLVLTQAQLGCVLLLPFYLQGHRVLMVSHFSEMPTGGQAGCNLVESGTTMTVPKQSCWVYGILPCHLGCECLLPHLLAVSLLGCLEGE